MPTSKQTQSSKADVAHSHGHKKMNLKETSTESKFSKSQPQNSSAMNRMAESDKIHRTESPQRRIITGAAVGKTGQRNKNSSDA